MMIIRRICRKIYILQMLSYVIPIRVGEGLLLSPSQRRKGSAAQRGYYVCAVAWLQANGRTRLRTQVY